MSDLADQFIAILQKFETDRDLAPIVSFFQKESTLRRAPRQRIYTGQEGAQEFWKEYLDAFTHVQTNFTDVTQGQGRVVLEWHSVATNKQGRHIEYDGCSVLEGEPEQVRSFRTYYDAAAAGLGAAVATSTVAAAKEASGRSSK